MKLLSKEISTSEAVALKKDLSHMLLSVIANYLSQDSLNSSIPPIFIKHSFDAALLLHSLISADYPENKVFHQDLIDKSVEINILATIPEAI